MEYIIERYKNAKDWNKNQTGGSLRKSFYYDEVDKILGCRYVVTFNHVAEAGISGESATQIVAESSDNTCEISTSSSPSVPETPAEKRLDEEESNSMVLVFDNDFVDGEYIVSIAIFPKELAELIRRGYKGIVLCPFPWCEDELLQELSKIFTRLRIVGKKKVGARQTKDTVPMTDVFRKHDDCKEPRVVLIEGQPGMGKTTYCQKLAYDWSVEDISPEACFPNVKLLLLLKCRDMKTANIEEAIDDQLLPRDADEKDKENFFRFIRCNQSIILLVFDGLDELSDNLFKELLPLIQGRVLSNTYIMLTARHKAGMKVRRHCDTLLEIVGYSSEDADNYIRKYFANHENPNLAKELIESLKPNPHLRELAVNPLNTALLCLLREDAYEISLSNKTTLYDELVSCVLRRWFAKKGIPLDDQDPIEVCAIQLNLLGKMAFEALLKDQLAFCPGELTIQSPEFLEFGFLSREASASKIRPKPSYAFTHKTFQEYFAAFYLAHEVLTGNGDKDALLTQLSPVDKFLQVWKFLVTMVARKNGNMAVLVVSSLCASFHHERSKKLPHDIFEDNDSDYDPYGENYLYELDLEDLTVESEDVCCDPPFEWDQPKKTDVIEQRFVTMAMYLIAQCEPIDSELNDSQRKMAVTLAHCIPLNKLLVPRGAFRYAAVLFEYVKASNNLTDLVCSDELNEKTLATIMHVLLENSTLEHLDLRGTRLDFSIGESLGRVLQLNRTLTHLNLIDYNLSSSGAEALAKALQSNNVLVHLDISCNWIGDQGAMTFAQALESNQTLTYFNLSGICDLRPLFSFGDSGLTAIAHCLQFNRSLTYLNLSYNQFSDSALATLGEALQSNSTLAHLNLMGGLLDDNLASVHFGDSAAESFSKALQSPGTQLTCLDLSNTSISPSCAVTLAEALQSNDTLARLDISGNRIGCSGAAAFGKALDANRTLTHLHLGWNKIGDSGATKFAEAMQSNSTLARLDLSSNKIGCSGAAALGKALKANRALTHLHLGWNQIGDTGATQFAEALPFNGTLAHLHLTSNKIGCSGAATLASALKSNGTLIHLRLGLNQIGDSGAKEFAESLQCNTTLELIDLANNNIRDSGKEIFQRIKPLPVCEVLF